MDPFPAYDPLFESPWLKWAQAIIHAQTLERELASWQGTGGNPVISYRAEYQPHRHGFAIIVEELEPIPVRWQLLLGDIAVNYRAALDHLAWALVSRGRTPPDRLTAAQASAVYFPISYSRSQFNAEIRKPPKCSSL
jgi:hypothetical protein